MDLLKIWKGLFYCTFFLLVVVVVIIFLLCVCLDILLLALHCTPTHPLWHSLNLARANRPALNPSPVRHYQLTPPQPPSPNPLPETGMWMSDKRPVQQDLARRLADFVTGFPTAMASMEFLWAFWRTMAREWHGIDVLRCVP